LAKYRIPSDAEADDLYSSALPMDELQMIFGRIEPNALWHSWTPATAAPPAGGHSSLAGRGPRGSTTSSSSG
jgi:hypothetical protein